MATTLAFDVYGTLIDTHGVVSALEELVGDRAPVFSQTWRNKQLEYSFRRGLMQQYEDFAVCTQQALDYTCSYYQTPLSTENRQQLLASYRQLPAFDDVEACLAQLKAAGCQLYAFSNGTAEAVDTLLVSAGIRDYFLGVISVDDLQTFKPNPTVYRHCLDQTQAIASDAWLISSNPFDVLGAMSAGLNAAWVQRLSNAIFDPWGVEPTLTVTSLSELTQQALQAA